MAFLNRTVGTFACPECGTPGPHNFKIEDRATLRNMEDRPDAKPQAVEIKRFFVCTTCGHAIEAAT